MNFFKRLTVLILCFVMISTSALCVNAKTLADYLPIDTTNGDVVANFYDHLIDYVIGNYRYDVTRDELLTAAVTSLLKKHPELLEEMGKGAFEALDENSYYYNEEEFLTRYADVSGIFVGIGINVYQDENKIILGEAIPGSPAEGSGLEVGDILVAVDDERVENYGLEKVTSLIKGEEGTFVKITVLRNGMEFSYTINRALIKINPVTYNLIENTDIAYVKLASFNANTIDAMAAAMEDLNSKGVKKIILDLRNNMGGYMNAAIAVASYFVPDGKLIASEEYKNEKNNKYHYANKTPYKFKGVVLINEYSASASELVSGAVKDYGTATLVGQTSFGKGTVQMYIPLRSNHYLWYTVAEYYTPSHNPIHKTGISPHHYVMNKTKDFDMSTVTPYQITRVLKVGDTGADVQAVKERLKILGYVIDVNDVYDEKTANAISDFQKNTEIFSYGVADITTQIKINDVLKTVKVPVDKQLEKALELAKNLK